MARYTEQNVYYAKRMALYGKGGTSGGAGRRYAEWGALGRASAARDDKTATMKF